MAKASDKESGSHQALFSGTMDIKEMDELLNLYRELYPLSSTELEPVGEYRLPGIDEAGMRLEEGFTLLQPKDLMPSADDLNRRGSAVLEILSRHSDKEEAIGRLAAGLKDPELLPSLVALYLEEGEEKLREEMVSNRDMDEELGLFLVFNTMKGSFRRVGKSTRKASFESWEKGMCPVCGGLPAVACLRGEEGQRHLICHRCEAIWRFARLQCPFCGNTDHQSLGYFTLEDGNPIVRVDFCGECSSYVKSWDIREMEEVLPEYEDLKTIGYDLAAEGEGYRRGAPNIFGIWIGFDGKEEKA